MENESQNAYKLSKNTYKVKLDSVVSSIKQSPVLKGHLFLVLS